MGGFAAITFSKILHASNIIAISPQYAIDEPSDQRWALQAKATTWNYRMSSDKISAASMYLIYDDKIPLEVQQINKIVTAASGQVDEIYHLKFPLSGHPTGTFLAQVGLMSHVVSEVLDKRISKAPQLGWQQIRRSSAYFLSLSQITKSKGRARLEILALQRAVDLRPDHALARDLLHDAKRRTINSAGQ